MLTHGALRHARTIAEGMVVDAAHMARNLALTGGLFVAEAVMMGLAPHLGREAAHYAVKHACDRALATGMTLEDALMVEPDITARLDRAAVAAMVEPASYLGATGAFIDRVLARV